MESAHFSLIKTWQTEENIVRLCFKERSRFKEGILIETLSKEKTERVAIENIRNLPIDTEEEPLKVWSCEEIFQLFEKCHPKVDRSSIEFIQDCFEGMIIKVLLANKINSMTNFQIENDSIPILLGTGSNNIEVLLEADPMSTIEQIEQKVKSTCKISAYKQIFFVYRGKVLEENRTLVSYKITDGSLLVESGGEREITGKSFQFNSCSNPIEKDFAKKSTDWLIAERGLNLIGRCRQIGCKAQNQYVCIQKGFGEKFQIGKEKHLSKCPAGTDGHFAKEVNNLVFWDCDYTIEGFREKPREEPFNDKGIAPKERYITFKQGGDLHDWAFLDITTKRR